MRLCWMFDRAKVFAGFVVEYRTKSSAFILFDIRHLLFVQNTGLSTCWHSSGGRCGLLGNPYCGHQSRVHNSFSQAGYSLILVCDHSYPEKLAEITVASNNTRYSIPVMFALLRVLHNIPRTRPIVACS